MRLKWDVQGRIRVHESLCLLAEGEQRIEAFFLSGVLAYFMGRKETAIQEFDEALKLDPGHVNSSVTSLSFLSLGEKSQAENRYLRALALDPGHVSTHCNYGNLFLNSVNSMRQNASSGQFLSWTLKMQIPAATMPVSLSN